MKTSLDFADIVRRFSGDYITHFGDVLLPSQKKAIFDIATCHTAARGGRLFRCDDCDHAFWIYHGCRNRTCPKCHGGQIADWLAKREVEHAHEDIIPGRIINKGWSAAQSAKRRVQSAKIFIFRLRTLRSALCTLCCALCFRKKVSRFFPDGSRFFPDGSRFFRCASRFFRERSRFFRCASRFFRGVFFRFHPRLKEYSLRNAFKKRFCRDCRMKVADFFTQRHEGHRGAIPLCLCAFV